ncbi:hypothetical protein KJ596_01070 [Patescibacteria group bacterium]|nr:hypothetical protein [Patescibacteria group bacterium]MBU1868110.1 hypothetical protein [Patescibacteria group bacterium]
MRQSPLFLILICVITTILVVVLTIYPWIGEIGWMKREIATREALLNDKLLPKVNLLQSLTEVELDSSIAALEEALPSFPQEWSVFASLEALAAESKVELGLLNIGSLGFDEATLLEGGGRLMTVDVPITSVGDLSQTVAFLKNIERAKRVLSLAQLSLGSDGEEIRLSGIAIVPFLPVPSKLGPVDEPLEELKVGDQDILAQVARLNLYGISFQSPDFTGGDVDYGKSDPF